MRGARKKASRPRAAGPGLSTEIAAQPAAVAGLRAEVRRLLAQAGCAPGLVDDLELAVDEALHNVIHHTYKDDQSRRIRFSLKVSRLKVRVLIRDDGPIFDSEGLGKVDLKAYVREKRRGGLGVSLMKKLMDKVEYRHGPRQGNTLILEARRGLEAAL